MQVISFPAGGFGTNCYVLAPTGGDRCVIIDPGQSAADPVAEIMRQHDLTPEAVLLTHGHMDHTWDVVPVCGRWDIPVYVPEADRFMLADPAKGLPDSFPRHVLAGHPNAEPADVRPVTRDGEEIRHAGLTLVARHCAGHTPGSTMWHCTDDEADYLLTGDVLLAGALGNTEGPGGSAAVLRESLHRICAPLDGATVLLPGHGGATTLAAERRQFPIL
ncbi:MBL fold metallo-hydrolase [Micromonospora sp. NPDC047557]|uniref:MBL fold metallo-hydrolase n=1 Tax=Micromonospora sp. NPDC047557 TaxID=3364250 RepID=UPI003711A1CB